MMILNRTTANRRCRNGAVLPLVAISLVGLMSFVALAVDLGLLMVARNQCQNAADIAALAGTRALTGDPDTSYNQVNALPNAQAAATQNKVLGTTILNTQLTLSLGKYYYNRSTARFVAYPTDPSSVDSPNDPPSLVTCVVKTTPPTYFATIFGMTAMNAGATATAAHRPRDIALIIDFSGSMRLDSQLATPLTTVNTAGVTSIAARTTSRSTDTDFPQFGPYVNISGFGIGANTATSHQTASGEFVGFSNLTSTGIGGNNALVDDFYKDTAAFGTATKAFTAAPSSYKTTPDGDLYPKLKSGGTATAYTARNYNEVFNNTYLSFRDLGGNALSVSTDGGTNGGSAGVTTSNVHTYQLNSAPWTAGSGRMQNGSGHVPNLKALNSSSTTVYLGSVKVPAGTAGNTTGSPADRTVARDATFETSGYGASFKGYTTGPGYWGKTFFMWPPDPRGPTSAGNVAANNDAKDWRQRFFIMEFQAASLPGQPGLPSAPTTTTSSTSGTTGSTSSTSSTSSSSSSSSSSTTAAPPPPPPPPPSPLAYSVAGGLVHNNVLWNTSGTLRTPGQTVTIPTTYSRSQRVSAGYGTVAETFANTSHGVAQVNTTNYTNPTSTAFSAPAATTPFPQVPYGTYRYRINYDAILFWLMNTGANPFPSQLRAVGILYYASIPSTITSPGGNMAVITQAQRDMRFWKEYIDYVMGYNQASGGNWSVITQFTGFGDDEVPASTSPSSSSPFPLTTANGGVQINSKPTTMTFTSRRFNFANSAYSLESVSNFTLVDTRYMDYRDNPRRPVAKYWFGPMTMIDFLGNFNTQKFWWPGTCHEAPLWQLKTGVQTALGDVKNNHPNDYLSVIGFSVPKTSSSSVGYYNAVRAPLSQDYKRMINSLWFPQYVIDNRLEITPYDYVANTSTACPGAMDSVPRSVQGTCSPFSMMLAYNQFSNNSTSLTFAGTTTTDYGMAGGLGRLGAKKVIIFETDGVASATSTDPSGTGILGSLYHSGSTSTNGTNNSYYKIRWNSSSPEYPDYVYGPATNAVSQTKKMAELMTNRTDSYDPIAKSTGMGPGFATTRSSVSIHCIAFGTLFNSSNTSSAQTQALDLLQYMQYRGGNQPSASTALDTSKIINQSVWDDGANNPATSRKAALQKAFSKSLQDNVGVVLIR